MPGIFLFCLLCAYQKSFYTAYNQVIRRERDKKAEKWIFSLPRLLLRPRYRVGGCLHDKKLLVVKAVQRYIQSPTPRTSGRNFGGIEKLVNGKVEIGYELIKYLQAGVLPLVLDIRKIPGVYLDNGGGLFSGHTQLIPGLLDGEAKRPEIV